MNRVARLAVVCAVSLLLSCCAKDDGAFCGGTFKSQADFESAHGKSAGPSSASTTVRY